MVGDGASVMVSSRKEANVLSAVERLRQVEGGRVEGVVCHVGKSEHRTNLIKEVRDKCQHGQCKTGTIIMG